MHLRRIYSVSKNRQNGIARNHSPPLWFLAETRIVCNILSQLPETMRLPSGLNATLVTLFVCPLRVRTSFPVCASHTLAVLSELPERMRLPSGLHATLVTSLVWPLRERTSVPLSASHTLAVLSPLPVRMRLPSALHATLLT